MRKPINKENCTEIGYVKKTHGVSGGLHLNLADSITDSIEKLDFLFLEIDGLLVPFFIKSISSLGNEFAKIEFNNIDSKEKAQIYVGAKIFIDKADIDFKSKELSAAFLVGFKLSDSKLGEIGTIKEVNDYGGNIVLLIDYKNIEVMLPFNEDLVLAFDQNNSSIEMNCPEGIFDLTE